MESQAQHLPASAMTRVEFHVELVMRNFQAAPCEGTTRGRAVGAESTWIRALRFGAPIMQLGPVPRLN